jgi:putative transposase
VAATCWDLDVVPRFIPLREPWRNGVVEHFNDVWDKSFFRTERFRSLDHLRKENAAFVAFHNEHHRYSAPGGASPDEVRAGRTYQPLLPGYVVPASLPAKGRIEVVRYIRSNGRLDLFGKRLTVRRGAHAQVRHRHHPGPGQAGRRGRHGRRGRP